MSLSDQTGMSEFLALARKVKTQAGAERFDQPIGSSISDSPVVPPDSGEVTPVRLRSLQRQYLVAKNTGNKTLIAQAQRQFRAAFRAYAAKNSLAEAFLAVNEADEKKK